MDLRRFLQTVQRYKLMVSLMGALGLIAGAALTVVHPPTLASKALVVLPATRFIQTQVVIAGSDPVLASAMPNIEPAVTLQMLQHQVQVKSVTSDLLAIDAEGKTAAQAENIANAVADSYLSYISSPDSPGGRVLGRVLQRATTATGTPLPLRLTVTAVVGLLLGALLGAFIALGISRTDRKLRERDEIADAIGVPVVASIPVGHPSDAAGWTKLLEGYEPGVVHAWSMRKALHHLGLTDYRGGAGPSLCVLSLSSDAGALALGPQVAVFAASLGIPTALIISSQQDTNATATLSAACTVTPVMRSGRPSQLRVIVGDHDDLERRAGTALTIVVAVVDGRAPRVNGTMRTSATVLGVSAGAATAEQLARVAVSAAGDGRDIAGILVADPDSTDHTTGRLPQPGRPSHRRQPTRLTGTTPESRQ